MSFYLKVRKWVDRDIGGYGGRPISLFVLQPLAALIVIAMPSAGWRWAATLLIGLPVAIWTGFVFWRCGRMAKACHIRAARYYESHTRHALSAEYADSEDAYLAKRRDARQGLGNGR